MLDFKEFVTGQKRSSKRSRILDYWRNLRPDMPMVVKPIASDHHGSTKSEDGIRITGSAQFVASVVSRLKELLGYENYGTKIEIVYRRSTSQMENGKLSYVMYIQVKERTPHKIKVPKLSSPGSS